MGRSGVDDRVEQAVARHQPGRSPEDHRASNALSVPELIVLLVVVVLSLLLLVVVVVVTIRVFVTDTGMILVIIVYMI